VPGKSDSSDSCTAKAGAQKAPAFAFAANANVFTSSPTADGKTPSPSNTAAKERVGGWFKKSIQCLHLFIHPEWRYRQQPG
jgi:hypothetical protein